MAKVNKNKIAKNGEYAHVTLPVRRVMQALKEGKIMIPKEQRDVKATGKTYCKKRDSFLAYMLVHAFTEREPSEEFKQAFIDAFGDDIKIVNGSVQFIGISMDANGYLYLSDGQHRFVYYLKDFFDGVVELKRGTDFGNDYLNDNMEKLFDAIELDDDDGVQALNVISKDTFYQEDLDMLLDMPVMAQCVKALDDEERSALFVAMNAGTQPSQADLDKANYGNTPMYQGIDGLHKTLDAVKIGEPIVFANGKKYSAKDTTALKLLLNAPMRTLVPVIAHAALLTYLPKKVLGLHYRWEKGFSQTQEEQVRNFFKATSDMTEAECEKFLMKIVNDVVSIGKLVYDSDSNLMNAARGMKSLIVGQLNAWHNKSKDITKDDFSDVAANITREVIVSKNYLPIGSAPNARTYDGAYFNNGHRVRGKNELFAQWVNDEYTNMKEVC